MQSHYAIIRHKFNGLINNPNLSKEQKLEIITKNISTNNSLFYISEDILKKIEQDITRNKETALANRIGIHYSQLEYFRRVAKENFHIGIGQAPETNGEYEKDKFYTWIDRRHDSPSGSFRLIPFISCNIGFNTKEEAVKKANKMKTEITLSKTYCEINKVPQKLLMLLPDLKA